METGRDLACPALWQASLERSLARRGRPTRSSLELFQLRPERDLSRPELLRESLMYSQLRRSAVSRRPAMAVPSAGGISALALLAAATLPGLAEGGGSGRTGSEQTVFGGATSRARLATAPVAGVAARPALAAAAPTHSTTAPPAAAGTPAAPASVPARAHMHAAPRPSVQPSHIKTASVSSSHSLASPHHATAPRYVAAADDAVAPSANGGVAHALSGGAAPAARKPSAAAPRVPANPQPLGHPSTGGGAIEHASHNAVKHTPHTAVRGARARVAPGESGGATTSAHTRTVAKPAHAPTILHRPTTTRPAVTHPVTATHPAATHPVTATHPPATHPVTATHPPATHPVTASRPTATTRPAPRAPAPAPAPAPSGRYVNPLAGASVTPERIDQGVDYAGSGTLGAIGDGKVTYVGTSGTGWPGAFVEYQLTSGSFAGRYVYYAESISPAGGLHVGEAVRAGQPIASINGGIEIGWGSGVGTQALAQADGQWSSGADGGNHASADGKDFSALIAQLGGPAGKVEG